jgi:hypothetical protein
MDLDEVEKHTRTLADACSVVALEAGRNAIKALTPVFPNFDFLRSPIYDLSKITPIEIEPFEPLVESAQSACEKILAQVNEYQAELPEGNEVAFLVAYFGSQIMLRVEEIGYQNPQMIILIGTIDGQNCRSRIIQHLSQLNIVLMALPVIDGAEPREVTGFKAVGQFASDLPSILQS